MSSLMEPYISEGTVTDVALNSPPNGKHDRATKTEDAAHFKLTDEVETSYDHNSGRTIKRAIDLALDREQNMLPAGINLYYCRSKLTSGCFRCSNRILLRAHDSWVFSPDAPQPPGGWCHK
ncbi:unnamed protein product, partial [Iphiclides podalirius]